MWSYTSDALKYMKDSATVMDIPYNRKFSPGENFRHLHIVTFTVLAKI